MGSKKGWGKRRALKISLMKKEYTSLKNQNRETSSLWAFCRGKDHKKTAKSREGKFLKKNPRKKGLAADNPR